ncbi:chemotaxis protein CheW [Roseateles cellulosilyticus]|uniref:Chemotaxis protein CheW n=1 Tax=Pelomonas cellulosilytica TaxID=2906762 RepID=A0ABS8XYR6_9BURK|nr:chemotaxis protein CheW [Pelomonas sp. P8]MCE4557769.1 chemotaxis protein CheW [Pelomonas sp. P8]
MNALVPTLAARDLPAPPAAVSDPTQFLTFMLGGEMFAIGILAIKEIIEYQSLTEVPMMPASVRGVINLRGAVVPVMDLLARFGRPSSDITKRSCIVIVEVQVRDGERVENQVVGIIVDSVSEVLDIAPADIEPPPSFGTRIRGDFIQGMGKVKGKFVILLDLNQVLALDELAHGDTAAITDGSTESH